MAAAEVKSGLHAPIELTRAEADLTRFDVGRIRAGRLLANGAGGVRGGGRRRRPVARRRGQAPPAVAGAGARRRVCSQAIDADPLLRGGPVARARREALTRAIAAEMRPDLALTATFSGRAGTATPSSGSISDQYGPLPDGPELGCRAGPALAALRPGRRGAAGRGGQPRARSRARTCRSLSQQEAAAVQQAYVSLEVSQAALVSLERAVEAARANYAQAEARFKAGLGTSLELADAEALRTDAEIQLAVGQFEARRARAVARTADRGGAVKALEHA